MSRETTKSHDKLIQLRVVFDRLHRKTISTGIYVAPEQWDAANERVCNHPGAELLNARLSQKKKAIQELELSCIHAQVPFTPEYLTRILTPERLTVKAPEPCFTEYMYQALCRQTDIKYSSVQDQFKTYKRFARYYPKLLFKDFTYNILVDFESRCRAAGHAPGTIWKHHKNLRKYLNLAEKEGVYAYPPGKHPYSLFKVKKAGGNRDFLSETELARLESGTLPSHLDPYRKMFLFICYTGLRISDFMRLEPGMLHEDILVLTPQKTETTSAADVHLPLKMLWDGKPWRIWESFNFHFPTQAKGFSLKFNAALKVIALHLNIPKKLTCHVGRHTFLTHLAMKTGNVFQVMRLGGICQVDTAMIYIHLAEQDNTKFLAGIKW